MVRHDTTDWLLQVSLFAACTKKDLKALGGQAERVRVSAGRVLCSQGETGREFFMILSGQAKVTRNNRKVATLGRGQSFGELALLDPGPRNATIVAETDMELAVVGQREFARMVDSTPGFAYALLEGIAARVRESDDRDVG